MSGFVSVSSTPPPPSSPTDETLTYTEPLILRVNGPPERLRNGSLAHTELTTPSKTVVCE